MCDALQTQEQQMDMHTFARHRHIFNGDFVGCLLYITEDPYIHGLSLPLCRWSRVFSISFVPSSFAVFIRIRIQLNSGLHNRCCVVLVGWLARSIDKEGNRYQMQIPSYYSPCIVFPFLSDI